MDKINLNFGITSFTLFKTKEIDFDLKIKDKDNTFYIHSFIETYKQKKLAQ